MFFSQISLDDSFLHDSCPHRHNNGLISCQQVRSLFLMYYNINKLLKLCFVKNVYAIKGISKF